MNVQRDGMMGEGKPRFKPNWLTWDVDRQDRTFRVYVVEPRVYSPKDHPSIFWAAMEPFVSPPQAEYLLGSAQAQDNRPPVLPKRFDLLTFPEAFLPPETLLEFLRLVSGRAIHLGCVHAGLRPSGSGDKETHLFKVKELINFVANLRDVPNLAVDDLGPFSDWLDEQCSDDMFNVGCLLTIDAADQIRICLHPKLVRSRPENSAFHDKHMKEANLLSLVTLRPTNKNLSFVTIQPLICADVLKLGTDQPNTPPIEAVSLHRSCFGEVHSDDVDVVSVATCTPNTVRRTKDSQRFEWHQEFRSSFVRTATEDQCRRHRQAAIVLSNFRYTTVSPKETWGGLSGVFIPLPVFGEPYHRDQKYISKWKTIFGYFPQTAEDGAPFEDERWIDGDTEEQKQAKRSEHGYIVALDPNACREKAVATMLGFTITRLPRDADRRMRTGSVSDVSLHDAVSSVEDGEPRIKFKQRPSHE